MTPNDQLIHQFLETVSNRSPVAMPLLQVSNIAIVSLCVKSSFLLLDFDVRRPLLLEPEFQRELRIAILTARDILEIDRIRIDSKGNLPVMAGYKNGGFYREVLNVFPQ